MRKNGGFTVILPLAFGLLIISMSKVLKNQYFEFEHIITICLSMRLCPVY